MCVCAVSIPPCVRPSVLRSASPSLGLFEVDALAKLGVELRLEAVDLLGQSRLRACVRAVRSGAAGRDHNDEPAKQRKQVSQRRRERENTEVRRSLSGRRRRRNQRVIKRKEKKKKEKKQHSSERKRALKTRQAGSLCKQNKTAASAHIHFRTHTTF